MHIRLYKTSISCFIKFLMRTRIRTQWTARDEAAQADYSRSRLVRDGSNNGINVLLFLKTKGHLICLWTKGNGTRSKE